MTTPTQKQWREMMARVLGAWVAETAGETRDNETYNAAEKMIEESLAAERPLEITHAILQQIMPSLPAAKRSDHLPHLNLAMVHHDINTPMRAAAFLAQIAHESGELKYFEEIWGPTDAQKRYEGRKDLGNTQPGDGKRYRGRGPVQITGRANYRKYGGLLGIDLEGNPDLAAKPEFGFLTAALYWKLNKCNEYADQENFKAVTRAINGGLNGLADREKYYSIAKKALGVEGN